MNDTQTGKFQFIDCSSITIKKENIEEDLQYLTDSQVKVKEEFVEDEVDTFEFCQVQSGEFTDCKEETNVHFALEKEYYQSSNESHNFLVSSLQTNSHQSQIESDGQLTNVDEYVEQKPVCKINSESVYDMDECQDTSQIYKCKMCGESFSLFLDFMKHQLTHQQLKEKLSCVGCGRVFTTRERYHNHSCSSSKVGMLSCDKCNMKFNNTRSLRLHKAVHSTAGPFSCHACDKTFDRNVALIIHKRSHLEESTDVCSICPQKSRSNACFNQCPHSSSPHQYLCQICGVSFISRYRLSRHKRNHSDL